MTSVTLQYRVESVIDSLAAHLLDRTGRDVSIEEFDMLTQELSERLDDLLTELIWDAPSRKPVGDGSRGGDGREPRGNGQATTPSPESSGSSQIGEGSR